MSISVDGNLYVYLLNVGQADTSVIVTPGGGVIVIDAVQATKLVGFLTALSLRSLEEIELLLITHPHTDHFSGAARLIEEFRVKEAVLAPFWHDFGMGPATYRDLMEEFLNRQVPCRFLAGYTRSYPDALLTRSPKSHPEIDPNAPFLEMLGPSNGLVKSLERQRVFDTNHLSIMSRLVWKRFRMIFAADAQMENWGPFDSEELLKDKCHVLRASHHGSGNGTQWERLHRLSPRLVFISSDPDDGRDSLPDAVGATIFTKYNSDRDRKTPPPEIVAITKHTGTVRICVKPNGKWDVHSFAEDVNDPVTLASLTPLRPRSNPTDWKTLARKRLNYL